MKTPQRALAFVAHPDDEAWLLGGTLATWAAAGADVLVVCATDGERGKDRRGVVVGASRVGALRRGELQASCRALGVQKPVFLGLPDGGLSAFPVERGEALIRTQLQDFAPDLVLTHGQEGDYGHLDHITLMRWVTAVRPDAWLAALPPGRMFGIWRKLRRFGFDGVARGMSSEDFGSDGGAVLALDSHASAAKQAALSCHESQLLDGDLGSFLERGLITELLAEERFVGGPR